MLVDSGPHGTRNYRFFAQTILSYWPRRPPDVQVEPLENSTTFGFYQERQGESEDPYRQCNLIQRRFATFSSESG